MILDEAIKHYEQLAENQIKCADRIDELHCDSTTTRYMAEHHRQLAEWLRELKEYRKFYSCRNCYNASASFSDYPCCECRRCFKALDGIKDHYEEVNSDDNN